MNLSKIKDVRIMWITKSDDQIYRYVLIPNSLKFNLESNSIRIKVKEINLTDDPFEAIISNVGGKVKFRGDCNDNPNRWYFLEAYESSKNIILFLEDDKDIIYFHLTLRLYD